MTRHVRARGQETLLTVSDFLEQLNSQLVFVSEDITIQGEIFALQPHPSGIYLSLKDKGDGSILNCYIHPRTFAGFGTQIEDGMEIKIKGYANIYKPKGKLSFVIEYLELAGEGALKKAYELLKNKLEAEGFFARKRPLPNFIQNIGLITSRTGAVIDDFRKNIAHLGFALHLINVRVEGAQAAGEIVRALTWFNQQMPNLDVLVIMRGGGSLEDLQAFNNELVVRAIFTSKIPTICAIGHDRDLPIAQMVADVAPSTPTAAALAINQSWQPLIERLPVLKTRLVHYFERQLSDLRSRLNTQLLIHAMDRLIGRAKEYIISAERYLAGVDPLRPLKLGYSIAYAKDNAILRSSDQVATGDPVTLRLHQGIIETKVTKK